MNVLIVGGTRGLGLSLAEALATDVNSVYVTGRKDPGFQTDAEPGRSCINFVQLDLSGLSFGTPRVQHLLDCVPQIDLLVYAAGFYQEGTLTELAGSDIDAMIEVGLVAPIFFVREVLKRQGELPQFAAITSTSQWTPRLLEPVYAAVKAGLGALANSLSLDPRIGKTLVAGPAGMDTEFWAGTGRDTSDMLDPDWVAAETLKLLDGDFSYKFAHILRGPQRVEVQEVR